ncbi:MlaD family protein [Marinigracilibium pacificum]|uniref:MCE family protein n=1 Tax=Marinigracilibium pacificum TaxID=2729599 RepID=A0A848IVX3_9BACT|nr:MlaD family protein [Marinigracilibium pacificum]NMM47328.1 MCE family protein [Marinigracilibium pacificum]
MKDKIKLGLFVFLAVTLLILGMYFVGARKNLFSSNIEIQACFKNVAGIQKGSAVQFVGINVGAVEKVKIIDDSTVCLVMSLNNEQAQFITKDAVAQIGSEGLMGNKMVSITPGSTGASRIEDGDELSSKEPVNVEDIMASVMQNSKNLEKFTGDLAKISQNLIKGRGLAGRLLTDTISEGRIESVISELELTVANLHNVSADANDISTQITEGKGMLGKLVYDKSMAEDVEQLMDSLNNASAKLNLTLQQLTEFTEKMNNGKGTLSLLVNDSTMAYNLDTTIINAKQRVIELEHTIDVVNESWLLNLFNKKNKEDQFE